MAILKEDSKEITCEYCIALRQSFYWVALTAVVPIIMFTALLLIMSSELDYENYEQMETLTRHIIEAILVILYLQLITAAAVILISFAKRHTPLFKIHKWYLAFHIILMVVYWCLSMLMTAVNDCFLLTGVTLVCGMVYFGNIYRKRGEKTVWSALRRIC